MRERPSTSALKVPTSHFGKWGIREYLYYLLNQGENLENPNGVPERITAQTSPSLDAYEIGLIAATQAEADWFLGLIAGAMHKHLPSPTKHRFIAYGLDQAWCPQQLFDEVHWFNFSPICTSPQELLVGLGSIVHIHLLEHCDTKLRPGFRSYHWKSESDLAEFWASLYLSREFDCFLGLDWKSYFRWRPRTDCIATVNAGWGATPSAAVNALLASADATNPSHYDGEILIIEGGIDTRIGDYVNIVDTLERSLELDFLTTGWVSLKYSGESPRTS